MKRIVIRHENKIVSAQFDGRNVCDLSVYDADEAERFYTIGAMYIGKITNIVSNLNAAFVNIGNAPDGSGATNCFLPLDDLKPNINETSFSPIFIKRNNPEKVCPGDELLVQIHREPIKTKPASLTTHLSFPGRYAVILPDSDALSISKKILDTDWKNRMKDALAPYTGQSFGIILRTNAYEADINTVEEEIRSLTEVCRQVTGQAPFRKPFTCLYMPEPMWLTDLRDARSSEDFEGIVTDDPALYEQMHKYLVDVYHFPEDMLVLQQDSSVSSLYNVDRVIEDALRKRVWLNSGAYLVIEPTEALTVIDVNTGKAINKKDMRSHIFAINKEAAAEAARQIRLRNLSGIILIDFINMPDKEDKAELMNVLGGLLAQDPVKTNLIGISKLDLVEITRQKVRRPLHEAMSRRED
ncbi:MAG: ribonuclease E/G [Lachnospiraceae bacterium]|nr:ribonuclease E/G [Lachnospiraceae bacterium]